MVTDHKRNNMAVSFLAVFLPNISQIGIPEWVSMPFSRDRTQVSYIAGRFFTV